MKKLLTAVKKFFQIFWALDSSVLILLVLSISFTAVYKYIFSISPVALPIWDIIGGSIFYGQSQEASTPGPWWDIGYNVSISTVASIIFYFFIVHLKEFREKEILNPIVIKAADGILRFSRVLLNRLSSNSKVEISGHYPSKDELRLMCSKTNPLGDGPVISPINLKQMCWILCLNDTVITSSLPIDRLFLLIQHLPKPLIRLVIDIKENTLFNIIALSALNPGNCGVTNLDFMSEQMIKYFELMKELQLYLNVNYH